MHRLKQIRFFINRHPAVAFAAIVVGGLAVSTESPLPRLLGAAVSESVVLFKIIFLAIIALIAWFFSATNRRPLPKDQADGNPPLAH